MVMKYLQAMTRREYRSNDNDNDNAANYPHARCDLKRVILALCNGANRQNDKMERALRI